MTNPFVDGPTCDVCGEQARFCQCPPEPKTSWERSPWASLPPDFPQPSVDPESPAGPSPNRGSYPGSFQNALEEIRDNWSFRRHAPDFTHAWVDEFASWDPPQEYLDILGEKEPGDHIPESIRRDFLGWVAGVDPGEPGDVVLLLHVGTPRKTTQEILQGLPRPLPWVPLTEDLIPNKTPNEERLVELLGNPVIQWNPCQPNGEPWPSREDLATQGTQLIQGTFPEDSPKPGGDLP